MGEPEYNEFMVVDLPEPTTDPIASRVSMLRDKTEELMQSLWNEAYTWGKEVAAFQAVEKFVKDYVYPENGGRDKLLADLRIWIDERLEEVRRQVK
jgi:hypothetical protein